MDTRQKQKRQDEARQPAQTPIADAIVIGTAAGGLVLGTMQAQAAVPETQDEHQAIDVADGLVPNSHASTAGQQPAPVDDATGQAAAAVPTVEVAVQPAMERAGEAIEPAVLNSTTVESSLAGQHCRFNGEAISPPR